MVTLDEQNRALALFCVKYAISMRELLHYKETPTKQSLSNYYKVQGELWNLYDLLKGD